MSFEPPPLHSSEPPVAQRQIVIAANRIDARDLFSASREIMIAHGDDLYRLRLTNQNKLILTK